MSLTKDGSTLRERLNTAQPNTLADKLGLIALGNVLMALIAYVFSKVPVQGGTTNYNLATVQIVPLPDFAKAMKIERCYVRAGTVNGEFTPVAFGVTPATTQCAVTPNGDIAFLNADAVTEVDITYIPMKADIYEATLPVDTGVLTLPTQYGKVISLLEAEVITGTTLGGKIILVPAAGLPATTQARLNVAKTTVQFNNATDAPLTARVKFAVAPAIDLQSKLNSAAAT